MIHHHCHATGCTRPCPPEQLMCFRHWRMIPMRLRSAVWRAYRVGQCADRNPSAAYCEAAKAAVLFVANAEGLVADTRLYDILLSTRRPLAKVER